MNFEYKKYLLNKNESYCHCVLARHTKEYFKIIGYVE